MQEKESIIVVLVQIENSVNYAIKGSYNHVCKNKYFLFGTIKLEMNQMLF